jgi:hypothetical protein
MESPELASMLRLLCTYLYDRHISTLPASLEESWQMIFPEISFSTLQEMYSLIYRIHPSVGGHSSSIFLGKDEMTWQWIHRPSSLFEGWLPLLVSWTRRNQTNPYNIFHINSQDGRHCSMFKKDPDVPFLETNPTIKFNEYADFLAYRVKVIENIIRLYEYKHIPRSSMECKLSCHPSFFSQCKLPLQKEQWHEIVHQLGTIQPSDNVVKPWHHQNDIERTDYELCNCEDGGAIPYTYNQYISIFIQVRWVLVKIPPRYESI